MRGEDRDTLGGPGLGPVTPLLGDVQVDDAGLKGLFLCSTIITKFENSVKETKSETNMSLNFCS